MFTRTRKTAFYTMLLGILLGFSAQVVLGQEDQSTAVRPRRATKATSVRAIPNGQKVTLHGNVTKAGDGTFTICDMAGAETLVHLTNSTTIETHRRGIFRGSAKHDKAALLIGLTVKVEGKGNEAGELVAKSVRFHDSALKAEMAVDTRAIPIEKEQDRQADQLDETTIVATNARKEAKNAQESADKALNALGIAQSTADQAKSDAAAAHKAALGAYDRIAALDDFQPAEELTVTFKAGSFLLTKAAKAQLDEFAAKTATAKGFLVEISAFASSEGGRFSNHQLSALRAEMVADYLIGTGKVAVRRIVPLYSGGENRPIADNRTRAGRQQNRRVEVKMLVSKGLSAAEPVAASNH